VIREEKNMDQDQKNKEIKVWRVNLEGKELDEFY
jgi:hypothetical protein